MRTGEASNRKNSWPILNYFICFFSCCCAFSMYRPVFLPVPPNPTTHNSNTVSISVVGSNETDRVRVTCYSASKTSMLHENACLPRKWTRTYQEKQAHFSPPIPTAISPLCHTGAAVAKVWLCCIA